MIICEFDDGGKGKLRHAVVDNIVVKGGKILLVKRSKKLSEGGKWALPGGYIDRDETSAEAAVREILEETGWRAKIVGLLTINDNPDRPGEDNQNVALVYLAEAVAKEGDIDQETDEIGWFDLDKLPPKSQIAFDHAKNLELYKKYSKHNLVLPVLRG